MEEENPVAEKRGFKKYLIILVILIIVVGIIFSTFYLIKQNKCEKEFEKILKVSFVQLKCISECPTDSQSNFDDCKKTCNSNNVNLAREMKIDYSSSNQCSYQIEKLTNTDAVSLQVANCAIVSMTSIRNHLNDSSVPIETSCVSIIEKHYPDLLII